MVLLKTIRFILGILLGRMRLLTNRYSFLWIIFHVATTEFLLRTKKSRILLLIQCTHSLYYILRSLESSHPKSIILKDELIPNSLKSSLTKENTLYYCPGWMNNIVCFFTEDSDTEGSGVESESENKSGEPKSENELEMDGSTERSKIEKSVDAETIFDSNSEHQTPQKRKADTNVDAESKRQKPMDLKHETVSSPNSNLETKKMEYEDGKDVGVNQNPSHDSGLSTGLSSYSAQSCDIKTSEIVSNDAEMGSSQHWKKLLSRRRLRQLSGDNPSESSQVTETECVTMHDELRDSNPQISKCSDEESLYQAKHDAIKSTDIGAVATEDKMTDSNILPVSRNIGDSPSRTSDALRKDEAAINFVEDQLLDARRMTEADLDRLGEITNERFSKAWAEMVNSISEINCSEFNIFEQQGSETQSTTSRATSSVDSRVITEYLQPEQIPGGSSRRDVKNEETVPAAVRTSLTLAKQEVLADRPIPVECIDALRYLPHYVRKKRRKVSLKSVLYSNRSNMPSTSRSTSLANEPDEITSMEYGPQTSELSFPVNEFSQTPQAPVIVLSSSSSNTSQEENEYQKLYKELEGKFDGGECSKNTLEYKAYPGLSLQPTKVKKDARYQKKFYKKHKEVILPLILGELIQKEGNKLDLGNAGDNPANEENLTEEKYQSLVQELVHNFVSWYEEWRRLKDEDESFKKRRRHKFRHYDSVPPPLEKIRMKSKPENNTGYKQSSFMEESPPSEGCTEDLPPYNNQLASSLSPRASPARPSPVKTTNISSMPCDPRSREDEEHEVVFLSSTRDSPNRLRAVGSNEIPNDGLENVIVGFADLDTSSKEVIFCRDVMYVPPIGAEYQNLPMPLKGLLRVLNRPNHPTNPTSVEEFLAILKEAQRVYYEAMFNDGSVSLNENMAMCRIPIQRPISDDEDYELEGDTLKPGTSKNKASSEVKCLPSLFSKAIQQEFNVASDLSTSFMDIPTDVFMPHILESLKANSPNQNPRTTSEHQAIDKNYETQEYKHKLFQFKDFYGEGSIEYHPSSEMNVDEPSTSTFDSENQMGILDIAFGDIKVPDNIKLQNIALCSDEMVLRKAEMENELWKRREAAESDMKAIKTALAVTDYESDKKSETPYVIPAISSEVGQEQGTGSILTVHEGMPRIAESPYPLVEKLESSFSCEVPMTLKIESIESITEKDFYTEEACTEDKLKSDTFQLTSVKLNVENKNLSLSKFPTGIDVSEMDTCESKQTSPQRKKMGATVDTIENEPHCTPGTIPTSEEHLVTASFPLRDEQEIIEIDSVSSDIDLSEMDTCESKQTSPQEKTMGATVDTVENEPHCTPGTIPTTEEHLVTARFPLRDEREIIEMDSVSSDIDLSEMDTCESKQASPQEKTMSATVDTVENEPHCTPGTISTSEEHLVTASFPLRDEQEIIEMDSVSSDIDLSEMDTCGSKQASPQEKTMGAAVDTVENEPHCAPGAIPTSEEHFVMESSSLRKEPEIIEISPVSSSSGEDTD